MKHIFSISLCFLALSLSAQIDNFPFNPDSDYDGSIGIEDLMAMLSNYGQEFELPDYNEWAVGTMYNLLEYNDSLELIADSLSALQSQLSYVQDNMESYLDSAISANTSVLLNGSVYYNSSSGGTLKYVETDAVFFIGCMNAQNQKYRFPNNVPVGKKIYAEFNHCGSGSCAAGGNICYSQYFERKNEEGDWIQFGSINYNGNMTQWPQLRVFTKSESGWSAGGSSYNSFPTIDPE